MRSSENAAPTARSQMEVVMPHFQGQGFGIGAVRDPLNSLTDRGVFQLQPQLASPSL